MMNAKFVASTIATVVSTTSAYAQTSAKPSATLTEQGLKDFEAGSWYGVLAPAGTSRDIVTKLHSEIIAALKQPDVQKRFADLGTDIIGNSPAEFSAQISNERAKWAKVAQDAGIKPE